VVSVVLAVSASGGCGDEEPPPAQTVPGPLPPWPDELAIPPYAKHLNGVRICLDPGHGGHADRVGYKRGPTGLREAEVNLRVALFLRELLEKSGAKVFMTRTEDLYLHSSDNEDLRRRAQIANDNSCDIFLSVHHNASGRETANFSSVWYHAGVDHSPPSLDVARCLSLALVDRMNLPETLDVPVLSDELMYPRSGFAVLRAAHVPAVLSEGSFFSNAEEEARLANPEYNRREAHALFVGLAAYAYGGIPRARLIEPADGELTRSGSREVVIHLDDGLSSRRGWGWERRLILRDSIRVQYKGDELDFDLFQEEEQDRIRVNLPGGLPAGTIELEVQFENLFKHSNIQPIVSLKVVR
jgi:N-acetylmuramoyl-L-alanine amidase